MRKTLSLLCSLACVLTAQDSPTIRVSSRLVQISVVVHQKNKPVDDLTAHDFTVLDQGHKRNISLFSMSSVKTEAAKASPLPPGTFSNNPEHQPNRPSTLTIILFDAINTPAAAQIYARQEMLKFVRNLQPQDRVALYVLGRKLKVLIDFTADQAEIQRTLAQLSNIQTFEIAATTSSPSKVMNDPSAKPAPKGNLDLANQLEGEFITETAAQTTLHGLEAIANHVAGLPGRKNLVWITGGLPFAINLSVSNPMVQRRTFGAETKRATRLLNEANVAVYPVDARGLVQAAGLNGSQAQVPQLDPIFPDHGPGPTAPPDSAPEGIDSMKQLALLTGGRASYNSMDIKGAVRDAIDDSTVSYTLGFYLDTNSLDDKFHEIKVQVDRPGADVRYRKGYFAFKEEPHTDQQRRQDLADALWSPLESAGIPLQMRLERVDKPEVGLLRAYLTIDMHSLQMQQSNGHWQGGIDVLLVQQDKVSKSLESSLQTLNLDLDKTNYDNLLKTGIPFGKFLRPNPGLATVRAIVLDRVTGRIGSLIVPYSQVREEAAKQ